MSFFNMKPAHSYVLVLDQNSKDLQMLGGLLNQLRCPMVVASSADQAMAKAKQSPPSLIILSGNQQDWSQTLISRLRTIANHSGGIMIVALTDSHAPSWLRQEENPGLDGFLVKPLNGDVLTSLVQSAWARQTYMPYPGISG